MRQLASIVLSGVVALGLGAGAIAQSPRVHRSGATFDVSICADAPAPGFARCHAHVVTDNVGHHLLNRYMMRRMRGSVTPKALPAGYGPDDLRSAYNVTGAGSSSTVIAIVDAYGYNNAEADLAVYRSTFGLPACTSANGCFAKYNQNGQKSGYPRQNVGWAEESALDLDMASAMCPNCRIILVEASSASYRDLATAVNMAAKLGAHVISNSYGGGESGSQSYEAAYNHAGVAITASSGDSGYGVEFPATSPHVTAVGGTSLYRDSSTRGWSEVAWAGAGSGCSQLYSKPAWQTDPLCAMRMEADVSAIADPNTGVAVYAPVSNTYSAWQVFGGTSVAAPLVGGVYAVNGGTVSYASNPYANLAWLYDVVSGSNGSCGGTYFCTSGPNYDGPTGLGTPNGVNAF
jgi:subtilase family serine protease